MVTIHVQFLLDRIWAARFEEGDTKETVEWPPDPARLHCAMVASWAARGRDAKEECFLREFERWPNPILSYGYASNRNTVSVFVPVNDSKGRQSLLEERTRKERTFPSASITDGVYYSWPTTELGDEDVTLLDGLLGGIPSLGHSASLVEVSVSRQVPPGDLQLLVPDERGEVRLRGLYEGRFDELCERHVRFEETTLKVHRPDSGRVVRYSAGSGLAIPEPPAGPIWGEMVVFRKVSGDRAPLTHVLAVTSALRGAVMSLAEQPCPEVICGHKSDGAKLERPHLAFVALPFVSAPKADGRLMGLAAVVPRDLSVEERRACMTALGRIRRLTMGESGQWEVEIAGADEARRALRASTWMKPARQWATVTPFVFDRYPSDPYGEEACEFVKLACRRCGLPEPSGVAIVPVSPHLGVPHSKRFPPIGGSKGRPARFHHHVIVTFERSVAGPVLIGAGRYQGYGLCRAIDGE